MTVLIDAIINAAKTKTMDEALELISNRASSGIDLNAEDSQGWTALHHAATRGEVAIVKALLETGIKVNGNDPFIGTPLAWAIRYEQVEAVQTLVDYGANIKMREVLSEAILPHDVSFMNAINEIFNKAELAKAAKADMEVGSAAAAAPATSDQASTPIGLHTPFIKALNKLNGFVPPAFQKQLKKAIDKLNKDGDINEVDFAFAVQLALNSESIAELDLLMNYWHEHWNGSPINRFALYKCLNEAVDEVYYEDSIKKAFTLLQSAQKACGHKLASRCKYIFTEIASDADTNLIKLFLDPNINNLVFNGDFGSTLTKALKKAMDKKKEETVKILLDYIQGNIDADSKSSAAEDMVSSLDSIAADESGAAAIAGQESPSVPGYEL